MTAFPRHVQLMSVKKHPNSTNRNMKWGIRNYSTSYIVKWGMAVPQQRVQTLTSSGMRHHAVWVKCTNVPEKHSSEMFGTVSTLHGITTKYSATFSKWAAYHIISHHITSHHITSHHIVSYRIVSYHIVSYRIVSYRIVSYHIISYHIISYHIISYHIILYNIIYRIIYHI